MARYALVVGIAEYDSSSLPTLKKSATDAEAVAQALERYGNFQEVIRLPARWIKDENRYEIVPKKLTGQELSQALKTFLLEQAVKQEALIYFAGHGFQALSSMGVQNGYLATSNCAIDGRNAIPLDEFNWLISQSDLSSLVVLLDCCHAGSLLERNLLEPTLTAFDKKPDYYFITACRSFEKAYEGAEHGIFTGAVLKGLSPENADEDGQVSSDRLFDYIRRELKGSGQEPIRMGRGRSITLVTYSAANLAANSLSVSPSQPASPASPVSRSDGTSPNSAIKRLWNRLWVLVGLGTIFLLGTISVFTLLGRIGQPNCFDLARKQGKLAIAVANFHNQAGSQSISQLMEVEIINRLQSPMLPNAMVCPTDKSVSLRDEAQKLGDKLGAAVIIWGSRGGSSLKVNVTTVKINVRYLYLTTLPLTAANSFEFDSQTKDWPYLVAVMTAFNLSQIYQKEGREQEALETLHQALLFAESGKPDYHNEKTSLVLSRAYDVLGDLYAPKENVYCFKIKENCEAALKFYQHAFDLDKTFYGSLRHKGLLYARLGRLSEAMEVYTKIIESAPEEQLDLKLMVRGNRANIYLKQGQALQAVKDLEFVRQQQPNNTENLKFLGLAQLQAKQLKPATKTYQALMRYLEQDKAAQTEVMKELHFLAKDRPDLLPAINTLIASLR